MSAAAQVMTSGLLSSSPNVRSSSSGSTTERSDTSFEDTLDSASRSREAPENEPKSVTTERARGRKDGNDDATDKREEPGNQGEDDARPRAEPTTASVLSAMLAALGGTTNASEGEASQAVLLGANATDATAVETLPEDGPVLPGQVDGDGETVDADQLLLLLKTGAAPGASTEAVRETMNIKVTVAGQETHLALAQAPAVGAPPVADPAETTNTGAPAIGDDAAKASGLGALSQAVADAAKPLRARAAAAEETPAAKTEAGGSPRVVPIVEGRDSRGGAAVADQGIAGQDGRPAADGRNPTGSNAQPQASGAFMATLASAAQQVREVADAPAAYEPISQQIANEVRAELKADGLGETSSAGMVKVLSIELKPANLGSVTVRLALKDNAITVHIEAQRRDTLAVIEREREALVGALASAGYSVDGVTAAAQSDSNRFQIFGFGDTGSSAAQAGPQGQAGHGQGLGNSSSEQGRPGQAPSGQSTYHHPSDDKDANVGGVRRDADGLYV